MGIDTITEMDTVYHVVHMAHKELKDNIELINKNCLTDEKDILIRIKDELKFLLDEWQKERNRWT